MYNSISDNLTVRKYLSELTKDNMLKAGDSGQSFSSKKQHILLMMDYMIIIDRKFREEITDLHVFRSVLNFKVRKIFRDLKWLVNHYLQKRSIELFY